MTQTNKFVIQAYINKNRANIMTKYNEDMPIREIAKLYNVATSTIYIRLIKWGIKVKRQRSARRSNINRPRQHYKRKFSEEFLAHRAEIERLCEDKVKHIEFEGTTEDQLLVRNILSRVFL